MEIILQKGTKVYGEIFEHDGTPAQLGESWEQGRVAAVYVKEINTNLAVTPQEPFYYAVFRDKTKPSHYYEILLPPGKYEIEVRDIPEYLMIQQSQIPSQQVSQQYSAFANQENRSDCQPPLVPRKEPRSIRKIITVTDQKTLEVNLTFEK